MGRKLYKSETDRKILGVCGGIADYFGIDSTIVRLIVVFITLWGFVPGILIYIIAAFVMPASAASRSSPSAVSTTDCSTSMASSRAVCLERMVALK